MIVGSVAPRRLLYSHEFSWDCERDPVWPRLQKVFDLYGVPDHLASATGRGSIKGQPPENTHCNNIGPVQRASMYPALKRWLDIDPPAEESRDRHTAEELTYLTPEVAKELGGKPLYELADELAAARAEAAGKRLAALTPDARVKRLRSDWGKLLGYAAPSSDAKVTDGRTVKWATVTIERFALETEPGVVVPVVLLVPPARGDAKGYASPPVVVMVAQAGKARLLRERSAAVAELLAGGAAVCLPDVRGTGETGPGPDPRGRTGRAADWSQAEFMLGRTLLGERLRDLQSVVRHLRGRTDIDARRVALWGDSLAAPNPPGRKLEVPSDANESPEYAEPLGELLALLGRSTTTMFRAIYAGGGLTGFRSCLRSPFCYTPADAIVPGATTAGDLGEVAAALAPRPVRLDRLVDGLNRAATADDIARAFDPAVAAYAASGAAEQFKAEAAAGDEQAAARWLLSQLRR